MQGHGAYIWLVGDPLAQVWLWVPGAIGAAAGHLLYIMRRGPGWRQYQELGTPMVIILHASWGSL